MRLMILFILVILIYGCSTERIIVHNNTVEKPIEVIKECPKIPDCVCNYPEVESCPECVTDQKCQVEKTRAIAEVDYYKELISDYIINETYDNIQSNFTECLEQKKILSDQLNVINDSLN